MSDAWSDYMKESRERVSKDEMKEIRDGHQRAMDNIKRLGRIQELAKDLLLFSEPDGTITQGFRTQDTVKELQELLGWHEWADSLKRKELTMEDIEVGKEYYIRPIEGTKKSFYHKKVKIIGKNVVMAHAELLERAGKYLEGTTISVWPGGLSEEKEEE